MKNSIAHMSNCSFIKNFGYQGGVLFSETGAKINVENSIFKENFAFSGGVGFL
jgi:hypothetical protein